VGWEVSPQWRDPGPHKPYFWRAVLWVGVMVAIPFIIAKVVG
jgi:hypothetical protein